MIQIVDFKDLQLVCKNNKNQKYFAPSHVSCLSLKSFNGAFLMLNFNLKTNKNQNKNTKIYNVHL